MPELVAQRQIRPVESAVAGARKGGALQCKANLFSAREVIVEATANKAAANVEFKDIVREGLARAGVPLGPVKGGGARALPNPGYKLAQSAIGGNVKSTFADLHKKEGRWINQNGLRYDLMSPDQLRKEGFRYRIFHEFKTRISFKNHNGILYHWMAKREVLDDVMPPAILWKKKGRDWCVAYGKAYCERNDIKTEGKLLFLNRKIHDGLYRNGWLDDLHLESGRKWKRMTNDELRRYTVELITARRIEFFEQLKDYDPALVSTLRRRGILYGLPLKWKNRKWTGLEKDRFLAQVKEVAELLGVKTFEDFTDRMGRAYQVACQRGWVKFTGFSPSKVQWKRMLEKKGERALIKAVQKAAKAVGAGTRSELQDKLSGAYKVLAGEELLDKAGFPPLDVNRYAMMEEAEALAAIQALVDEKKIPNRTQLRGIDDAAYRFLNDNKLGGRIMFVQTEPDWDKLGDTELMAEINARAAAKGITGDRTKLNRKMYWAYDMLAGRELLEKAGFGFRRVIFSKMTDREVISHVKKLKTRKGITTGWKLRVTSGAAYSEVDERGLWKKVGLEPMQACGPGQVGRPKKDKAVEMGVGATGTYD
ncbi:MAG: hypothetical protein PHV13_01160 [Candidatus ainarchaeum sp.]|nr:hypothetical protein [Candidatus ainarchaeum sp.]